MVWQHNPPRSITQTWMPNIQFLHCTLPSVSLQLLYLTMLWKWGTLSNKTIQTNTLFNSLTGLQLRWDTVLLQFYVYGSVHRRSILITVQWDATQSSLFIILQVHSTCFCCQPHPSSVHKTVTTASGIGHIFCAATSLRDQAWPCWREVAPQKI